MMKIQTGSTPDGAGDGNFYPVCHYGASSGSHGLGSQQGRLVHQHRSQLNANKQVIYHIMRDLLETNH
ncbi:MAG: hypothetical protein MO846_08965 [Candidatus Devosia symbiotica]|nr:hypothetical protein [Candidatus Devosia symbiotica]